MYAVLYHRIDILPGIYRVLIYHGRRINKQFRLLQPSRSKGNIVVGAVIKKVVMYEFKDCIKEGILFYVIESVDKMRERRAPAWNMPNFPKDCLQNLFFEFRICQYYCQSLRACTKSYFFDAGASRCSIKLIIAIMIMASLLCSRYS